MRYEKGRKDTSRRRIMEIATNGFDNTLWYCRVRHCQHHERRWADERRLLSAL